MHITWLWKMVVIVCLTLCKEVPYPSFSLSLSPPFVPRGLCSLNGRHMDKMPRNVSNSVKCGIFLFSTQTDPNGSLEHSRVASCHQDHLQTDAGSCRVPSFDEYFSFRYLPREFRGMIPNLESFMYLEYIPSGYAVH